MLLLAVAMAGLSFWLLSGPREAPQVADVGSGTAEDLPPHLTLKFGTLTVRVRGPDGRAVPLAQVGYERQGKALLYGVTDDGSRTLTDVPLGEMTVLVEAPGYQPARRPTRIEAGLPEEITVVLTPEPTR